MNYWFRSKKQALLILIIAFFLGTGRAWSVPDFFSDTPTDILAEEILASMDDTELLGQVFLLGYFGRSPSSEIIHWIREKKIGGVKIFGWNAENLYDLGRSIAAMQRDASMTRLGIPLFIATDQEGGWVRHVKGDTSITPGNLAIGASGLPYDAYYTGYYIGEELRYLGVNMNFAPTVDVYANKEAHVIGPRAFSEDPGVTANLALAYYRGLRKAGIISTAKHFPGHGNATEDSHGTLPVIPTDFETLWERDLLPYRFLVKNDLPAIMSSHLSFPNILDDDTPASLSPYFMEEVIRDRLDFEGIVITDDMRMHGVLQNGTSIPQACLQALKAGNDMILISHDHVIHQRVWDLLYKELQGSQEFRSSLKESVLRILKVKLEYLKGENAVPLYPESRSIGKEIPQDEGSSFFFDQACRSASIIRNRHLPFTAEDSSVLLAGQLRSFLQVGRQYYPSADTFEFSYTPFYSAEEDSIDALLKEAANYDTLIYCLANPNSAEVLSALRKLDTEVIVLSVLTPIYLEELPWIETAVAVYGTGVDSFEAGFAVLQGMIPALGEVPLKTLKGN